MLSFQQEQLTQRVSGGRILLVRVERSLDEPGAKYELLTTFFLRLGLILARVQSFQTEE